jgi:hypothetical protein
MAIVAFAFLIQHALSQLNDYGIGVIEEVLEPAVRIATTTATAITTVKVIFK